MKALLWIVLLLEAIVAIVAGVMLFMIFSPSITINPTMVLEALVEGTILIALGQVALALAALMRPKHQLM